MTNRERVLQAAHAIEAQGYRVRNWSSGDSLVLAIYEGNGESYLGTLDVSDHPKEAEGTIRWYRKDAKILAELCAAIGPRVSL